MASSQYSPRSSAPFVGVGGDGDPLSIGVDRDSEIVAFDYDGREEGVKEMIRLAVQGCRRNGIRCGVCGQAPSDYPDMAEFLVCVGIESMSLNPDTVVKTTRQVLQAKQQLPPCESRWLRHDVGLPERLGPH